MSVETLKPTSSLSFLVAEFANRLQFDEIPDDIRSCVADHLLDTLGVGMAGRNAAPSKAIHSLVMKYGGQPQASVISGGDIRYPAPAAALVNGTYCHAMDFDDMHSASVLHPSAPVLPSVLAVAETTGATGQEFLTALTVGYEVVLRLGLAQYDEAGKNSTFFQHGFHATSILGTVAGAVACARLRRLTTMQIANALAISCSMGAGILEANRSGGTVKPVHCGWAAHGAVLAADMAAEGVSGPQTVLEGGFGFFPAFCGEEWSEAPLREIGNGNDWIIPSMTFKPYPCNGFTHSIVDAGLKLRQDGLDAADITKIEIGTAAPSWRTIGDPIEEKRNPQTPYHAAFSAPYVLACALLGGSGLGVGASDFSESRLQDAEQRELMSKCDVVVDQQCTDEFPKHAPGVVKVWMRDGSVREQRVTARRGGVENPLSRDELMIKLGDTAGYHAEDLTAAVAVLNGAPNIEELFSAMNEKSPR